MVYFTILDIIISGTVIAPLVVTFWVTTWEFIHKFPRIFPPWWTLYICVAFLITTGLLRYQVYETCKKNNKFLSLLISRLFIYVNVTLGIAAWKCCWFIFDTNLKTLETMIAWAVGITALSITGGVGNLVATPCGLSWDGDPKQTIIFTSAFNCKSTDRVWLYLLDCVFSVCVIGTLVIFVWRGTWAIFDLLLLPGNPVMSAWTSVIIGYSLVVLTFCLQPLMKYLAKTLSGTIRLLIVDIYLLFSFCGTLNVWRGIWNLLNHYFLPNIPISSFILTHTMSFIILMFMNTSNSILVRGVYLDGDEQGDQCVEFSCYYLRLFLQARRQKKLLRECEKRRDGVKRKGEMDTITILVQDNKKPITIIPTGQNNNEVTQPML